MDTTRTVPRYILRETMGIVIMGIALFWPAGKINWWQAWAVLAITLAWTLATGVVIARFHPALFAERLGPRKGARQWDTLLLSILGLSQLGRYILAGFDQRFGWTGEMKIWVQVAALAVCALGYGLFVWATAANAFFSQVVRVQTERGHRVVSGGPYRYLRHPAYAGAMLFELAVSFALASAWALIPSLLNFSLLILRTNLEDRTLREELAGYQDYSRRVRFRLLPGIW